MASMSDKVRRSPRGGNPLSAETVVVAPGRAVFRLAGGLLAAHLFTHYTPPVIHVLIDQPAHDGQQIRHPPL